MEQQKPRYKNEYCIQCSLPLNDHQQNDCLKAFESQQQQLDRVKNDYEKKSKELDELRAEFKRLIDTASGQHRKMEIDNGEYESLRLERKKLEE